MTRNSSELERLACQVIERPELLSDDLIGWLCSSEAKLGFIFWQSLGRLDTQQSLLSRMEPLGTLPERATAFVNYLVGVSDVQPETVSDRLDALLEQGEVLPEAILIVTAHVGDQTRGVERIDALVQQRGVAPQAVAAALEYSRLLESLSASELERLAYMLLSEGSQGCGGVVALIDHWRSKGTMSNELVDLAWRCLGAEMPPDGANAYRCDHLAAALAQNDIARGLQLLQVLLARHGSNGWEPLDDHDHRALWNTLCEADPEGAITLVLSKIADTATAHTMLNYHFRRAVDLERYGLHVTTYAERGEAEAGAVADSISSAARGFWTVAVAMASRYGDSKTVMHKLTSAALQQNMMHSYMGEHSEHLESIRRQVSVQLQENGIPNSARQWLTNLDRALEQKVEEERKKERKRELNEWLPEGADLEVRIWAIKKAMEHRPLEDILSLFSEADRAALKALLQDA